MCKGSYDAILIIAIAFEQTNPAFQKMINLASYLLVYMTAFI